MTSSFQRHLAISLLTALACGTAAGQSFDFVALGDLPYGSPEKAYPSYRALIQTINQIQPEFSIHVGDIKSGSTQCSDQELLNQREHFGMYAGAVVYTPGDNEWTDCHRGNNGSYDPLERLAFLRQHFFPSGRSLGQRPLTLENQSSAMPAHARYVENVRFVHQKVLFVTLHLVGSNNNFETRNPKAVAEYFERDKANIDWIESAFALAREKNHAALVFAWQADVQESKTLFDDFPAHSGFRNSVGQTLLPLAAQWGKPVLIVHGDTHEFRFDQPYKVNRKVLSNVTRLEVPGAGDVRAVRVTVDTRQPQPFRVNLIQPAL